MVPAENREGLRHKSATIATRPRHRGLKAAISARRGAIKSLGALALYILLAFLLFIDSWRGPGQAWIGIDGDPKLQMWFLGWTPISLARGQNPLFTDYVHYPTGANMMWNVSTPLPALLIWPVSRAAGLVVAYNVIITLALGLSAWCMYLAASRYTKYFVAAFAGGLLYGFSPYMIAQAAGHIHMVLAMFPPLALILLDEIFARQHWQAWVAGVLLGVAGSAQLMISEELLASTVVVAAVGALIALVVFRHHAVPNLRHTLVAAAWAAGTALLLAAYPLYFQFEGPLRVGGSLQPPDLFTSDLLTFVVPSDFMHFATADAVRLTHAFSGNNVESSGYFGIPMLLLLPGLAVIGRRSRLVLWAAAFTGVVALLSLGPVVHRAGHPFHISPPWAVLWQLPVVDNIIPARLVLFCYIGAALLIALGLHMALSSDGRVRLAATLVAVAVAFTAIFPNVPFFSTPATIPAFFQPGGDAGRIPQGSVVLVTPYSNGDSSTAMFWQAWSGYRFKMPEGEAYVPGPTLDPPPSVLQTVLVGYDHGRSWMPNAKLREQALAELRAWRVEAVVVGPSPGDLQARQFFTDLFSRPPEESGGVAVWWHPLAVQTLT